MNKNIWDMMLDLMAAAFFIAAVTILLNISGLMKQLNVYICKAVYDTPTLWQGESEQQDTDVVSYDDVCVFIGNNADMYYNIVVTASDTTIEITKEDMEHIQNVYELDILPKAVEYIRSYEYDDDGNIKKIVFEGRG